MNKRINIHINSLLHKVYVALLLFILPLFTSLFNFSSSYNSAQAQILSTPFPSSFRNTRANELLEARNLQPFFQKIHSKRPVKVMLIGDSHTKGNYYPRAVDSKLKNYFPTLSFAYYGINGAWARRFYEPDMIQKVENEHPDLVIISFGTNEAHGNFNQAVHQQTLTTLTDRIAEKCPGVCFIITTPPGSFISRTTSAFTTGGRGRRQTRYSTTKTSNERTADVARSIVVFGQSHKCAVWDIYTIAGGISNACTNWRDANLMAADLVHYNVQGYNLQGHLLGEAIYKAYISTPAKGSQTRMNHGKTPQEQKPYNSVKGF